MQQQSQRQSSTVVAAPPVQRQVDPPPHRSFHQTPDTSHRVVLVQSGGGSRVAFSPADPSQAALANAPAPLLVTSRGTRPVVRGRVGIVSDDLDVPPEQHIASSRVPAAHLGYEQREPNIINRSFHQTPDTSHRVVLVQSGGGSRVAFSPADPSQAALANAPAPLLVTSRGTRPVVRGRVPYQKHIFSLFLQRAVHTTAPETPPLPENFVEDAEAASQNYTESEVNKNSTLPPEVIAAATSLSAEADVNHPQWTNNDISAEDIKAKIEAIRTDTQFSGGEEMEPGGTSAGAPRGRGRPRGSGRTRSSLSSSSSTSLAATSTTPLHHDISEGPYGATRSADYHSSRVAGRSSVRSNAVPITVRLNEAYDGSMAPELPPPLPPISGAQTLRGSYQSPGAAQSPHAAQRTSMDPSPLSPSYPRRGVNGVSPEEDLANVSTDPSSDEEEATEEAEWGDYVTRCLCEMQHNDEWMVECEQCKYVAFDYDSIFHPISIDITLLSLVQLSVDVIIGAYNRSCLGFSVWQHMKCMGIDPKKFNQNDTYLCEYCKPRPLKWTKKQAQELQLKQLKAVSREKERKMAEKLRRREERKRAKLSQRLKDRNHAKSVKRGPAAYKKFQLISRNEYTKRAKQMLALFDTTAGAQSILDNSRNLKRGKRMFVAPDIEGLVSTEAIKQDDVIMEYVGHVCLPDECPGRLQRGALQPYCVLYNGLGQNLLCIDARRQGSEARFARREEKAAETEAAEEKREPAEKEEPQATEAPPVVPAPPEEKAVEEVKVEEKANDSANAESTKQTESSKQNESSNKQASDGNKSAPTSPKKSREERKLQAALAAIERKEEKEKRRLEAHKDSSDAKEKRGPGRPARSSVGGPGKAGKRQSDRHNEKEKKPEPVVEPSVRESPRGKKKSASASIVLIVLEEEFKENEVDEVSTIAQPPRKRWAAAVKENEAAQRASSPEVTSSSSATSMGAAEVSSADSVNPSSVGGKKLWLRRHAAESISEESLQAADTAASSEPLTCAADSTSDIAALPSRIQMSPPLKKRRHMLDACQSDEHVAATALAQMGATAEGFRFHWNMALRYLMPNLNERLNVDFDLADSVRKPLPLPSDQSALLRPLDSSLPIPPLGVPPDLEVVKKMILEESCIPTPPVPPTLPPPVDTPAITVPASSSDMSIGSSSESGEERMSLADRLAKEFGVGTAGTPRSPKSLLSSGHRAIPLRDVPPPPPPGPRPTRATRW
ncbi:hypothetical protein TELCIR_02670 [Teladorsagia circumcincta]|uniref:PHD-finger n=1 Tax=Teladorsagia circumcincta TaxID=45464 RepID=A0A2G9UYF9_TELCI|nr:hypothetical protein TELCIR_02670 [Teladorsagia circumcincta]